MDENEIGYDVPNEFEESLEPASSEITAAREVPTPEPLYRTAKQPSQYHIERKPPTAIVVHCGDPRFQKAFRTFIEEDLHIEHYVPIVVLGGVHAFGFKDLRPKHHKVLFEQIKFLVKEQGVKRIIVINHEDCRWYGRFSSWVLRRVPLPKKQIEDLRSTAESLLEHFLNIEVETYYAELDGDDIRFNRIS